LFDSLTHRRERGSLFFLKGRGKVHKEKRRRGNPKNGKSGEGEERKESPRCKEKACCLKSERLRL